MDRRQMFVCGLFIVTVLIGNHPRGTSAAEPAVERRLYVACPGIRNYLEFGGHGILVFDIDHGHRFLRRIPLGGLGADGKPLNIKGICGNAETGRLYVSTLEHLICLDLVSDQPLWQRSYEGGCDRMSISPDGSHIYLPTLEQDHWTIVDAMDGDELARVTPDSARIIPCTVWTVARPIWPVCGLLC